MACLDTLPDKYNVFLGLRSSTLLSSSASVSHRMLWGQTSEDRWTPGGLLPLISAQMPLFIVFSSETFLQTRTLMSENTFPKALIGHTSPRVHPRRFRFPQTFENKHQSQEQCCYYKNYKNKESKKITTKRSCVKPFWFNLLVQIPALLIRTSTMYYAILSFKLKSPWHHKSEMYRLLQYARDSGRTHGKASCSSSLVLKI